MSVVLTGRLEPRGGLCNWCTSLLGCSSSRWGDLVHVIMYWSCLFRDKMCLDNVAGNALWQSYRAAVPGESSCSLYESREEVSMMLTSTSDNGNFPQTRENYIFPVFSIRHLSFAVKWSCVEATSVWTVCQVVMTGWLQPGRCLLCMGVGLSSWSSSGQGDQVHVATPGWSCLLPVWAKWILSSVVGNALQLSCRYARAPG